MTNRKLEYWVIPPKADGEFVANMEEVLETYAIPYNPARPVLGMDEQPVQLLKETRVPIPATRRHGRRVDYEYERGGTANIFMFTEPLAGWRGGRSRDENQGGLGDRDGSTDGRPLRRRRARDRRVRQLEHAHQRRILREFCTARARQLVCRIEFCYTPKHGSWLNIAENELGSLTRQCVSGRRFGDVPTLRAETGAWSSDVNSTQCGVDWQMKIDDARGKLTSVYPKIKL